MKIKPNNKFKFLVILLLSVFIGTNCAHIDSTAQLQEITSEITATPQTTLEQTEEAEEQSSPETFIQTETTSLDTNIKDGYYQYKGGSYEIIEVDGGDRSGSRQNNVAVDIGYGDRVYWGPTNDYGQLVYVLAYEVILQNDNTEPVNSSGTYYDDEVNVPGTERSDLDQGHVIADSLGGVSNAYNITPQDSTLNRHGDQAYMEKVIRDAGGCTNFVATITYPNTSTQIPSSYKYEYTVKSNDIIDEFPNANPEASTENEVVETSKSVVETSKLADTTTNEQAELAKVDTNGNGQVTIKEAKAAGYSMPIYSDHWLYKYMDDRDGDGMVGE